MNGLLRFYLGLASRLALRFRHFDRALELQGDLEKACADQPAVAAQHVMMQGHVWGLKGDRARARAEFERSLRMNPGLAVAHFNVGWVCDQQGLKEDALRHFERALALNPNLDRAWYGIGLIHVRRERHAEAKRAFQEVVRIDPMNMHGWYQLGMTHFVLGETDELEGLRRHTVRFNPKIAHLLDADIRRLTLQRKAEAEKGLGGGSSDSPLSPA
jgi:tetratricopeptide (TPR) repeat protein